MENAPRDLTQSCSIRSSDVLYKLIKEIFGTSFIEDSKWNFSKLYKETGIRIGRTFFSDRQKHDCAVNQTVTENIHVLFQYALEGKSSFQRELISNRLTMVLQELYRKNFDYLIISINDDAKQVQEKISSLLSILTRTMMICENKAEIPYTEFILEDTVPHKSKISKYMSRFIGTYYGYYFSSDSSSEITGAMLKLYTDAGRIKASLVTGIRSDAELKHDALKKLFKEEPVTQKQFELYRSSRTRANQRGYYYEGIADITKNSVLLVLESHEQEDVRKLVITLDTRKLPANRDGANPYMGGLAFVLTTSDAPFDTRFYQMGLINTMAGAYSLRDEKIANALKIHAAEKDIRLAPEADDMWYKLILDLCS